MRKNLFILSALLFFILIFIACKKNDWCDVPRNVRQSSINVTFKDKVTGKYLYTVSNSLYNKDSLKILGPDNRLLFLLYSQNQLSDTTDKFWIINFGNIYIQQTDSASFISEVCKDYIIQYSSNDFDTLQVCFKSKNIECGSVFETLKIYQRGQLLNSVSNDTFGEITIIKN